MAENRKEEIIVAAVDLAAKYGFNGVSMNMIADKVGVKKPSLYNHFKSKEKLIEEAYNFLRQPIFAKCKAGFQGTARQDP